ncbi:acyl-CoA thioesterase [Amycolatopsis sp. NBC_01480]|uniref:acyl-CoA thioesterase n=1 Tax=Amycolatopsis sp. NBC_01480 TaxID=2903562 RepID=UPI002E2A0DB9|nr:thioesterase family protein [Amycolatopsis sp. NBC_01480]
MTHPEPLPRNSIGAAPALSHQDRADDSPLGAVVERRVEWSDTDASGHHHNTAIIRWTEAAEAELLRRHNLERLWGRSPRVRHEINYLGRLWFGQSITIRLRVAALGRTSLTYEFELAGPTGVAATGLVVVAHAAPGDPSSTPWPEDVRAAFAKVSRTSTPDTAMETS